MHSSEKFEFDPSAFLDRSRQFLKEKKFPVGLLREALKDKHVRNVIARMEQVRQGEPTVTSITKKAGSTRFRVHELSPESPGGESNPELPDFWAHDYLAKLMLGRGASFRSVVCDVNRQQEWHCVIPNSNIEVFKPRPMTVAEYSELAERGVKMDESTSSFLLPPWDENFRGRSPWLSDGVYFGENGKVIHMTANSERTIWRAEDEVSDEYAGRHSQFEIGTLCDGSPDRGVRYAFEFLVQPVA